ncbi:M23 family metallopeptidase [Sphingomicrobium nitratireducens]|uniref:M23 family metallopeptidase n=1 Tax=Sphingomicrobium nitratireducens TaxID=2964666 RepID=UPI00223F36A8|nr:M23 family metallopeptidase [Sphingomicrobium nitratireducens]
MFVASLLLALTQPAAADPVAHRLYPPQPLIETTRLGQAINFDIELTNETDGPLELYAVRAAVRDPSGAIVQRLEVNDNGASPGIATLPATSFAPGEPHTLYNPFHTLAADIPIGRIDLEFLFLDADENEIVETMTVSPQPYAPKTRLVLPVEGRVLVWDGHDFYGHHRRFSFSSPMMKALEITSNPSRYSFDFVRADEDGNFHAAGSDAPDDNYSYGMDVVAPAAGTVVALYNEAGDAPAGVDPELFARDPLAALFGNYLVIDHGNGEYSQMGHFRTGSITVKVGDRVAQGQKVARAGMSGTSLFPHLHYQLATGPGLSAEGLPAYFDNIARVLGETTADVRPATWIDSGDLVETVTQR